jgi:uncharacterized protein
MECTGCNWDPIKDLENYLKHGVWFEDACCVFEDPDRREEPDDRGYDEDRWLAVGRVGAEILVVVFAERHGRERIISARKAEPKEERWYYARSRGF